VAVSAASTATVAGTAATQRSPGAEEVVKPARKPTTKSSKGSTVSRRDLMGRTQRFEARKVRRLIRHVDPWSIAKLSLVFFFAVWLMFMIAAVIVWSVAQASGTIANVESAFATFGVEGIAFDGNFIFKIFGLLGLIVMFASVAGAVISSVIFNLISDVIGGVWITVIEEETSRPVSSSPNGS
jgi:hypothetical protein